MVQELLNSQNCVVKYERDNTYCPICRYLNLPQGDAVVGSTVGEIRYMTCCQCYGTFRAYAEAKPKMAVKSTPKAVKLTAKTDKKVKQGHNDNKEVKKKKPRKTSKKKLKAPKKAKKEVNNEE